jgi:DNA ligase (NAD+)
MNNIQELEEIYLQAKEAYYSGEPIMSDEEFDKLEELLKENESEVIEVVGTADRNLKHQHLSPMLSLSKAQATIDGILPIEQMNNWFKDFPEDTLFEATPKYDGNAVNLIYLGGKFTIAITRGDKLKGRDVTKKLIGKVPAFLEGITNDVEVRGEVVMPTEIFNAKYVETSKNPRNMVAGILNRTDDLDGALEEIVFVGVEVRVHDGDYDYPEDTQKWLLTHGFNTGHAHYILFTASQFEQTYYALKDYRENTSPFQLDGFVIKAPETIRKKYGESGHHPNWAIAIKFPPKQAITKIVGFKWNVGTTGGITPIAQLEPIDLDGTTIRNVAAFNYGYIMRTRIFPGAIVHIAKSGDIIPQIVKVVTHGDESLLNLPTACPVCGTKPEIKDIHMFCPNDECEGKLFKKFLVAVRIMKMEKFGSVTCKTIYDIGYKTIIDIFDPLKFNKENLIASGKFKPGKTLDSLLGEIEKIKSVPLFKVIVSLGFDKTGQTASKQLAKMMAGLPYSYSGLEKLAVTGFEIGEPKRIKVESFITALKNRGIEIENEVDVVNGIGFEMTGSPKDAGYKVKSDLIKFLASHGYVHRPLKEAKILLTDSMTSSSSKMESARKLGVEIMTYSQLIEKLSEQSLWLETEAESESDEK